MNKEKLQEEIQKACKKVAPAWPLKNFVAVNPYLGLSDLNFHKAARQLSKRSGIYMCMPISFYLQQLEKGHITHDDIKASLAKNKIDVSASDFLKEACKLANSESISKLPKVVTLTETAEKLTKKNWSFFMIEKISEWASSYFDEYQALWKTSSPEKNLFHAWKQEALIDLSPKLMGLKSFQKTLKKLPENDLEASAHMINKLGISETQLDVYLHAVLLKTVGWSSYIAGIDWNNSLYSDSSSHLSSYLTILLTWEYCLFEELKAEGIEDVWKHNKMRLVFDSKDHQTDRHLQTALILQDAYDLSVQRVLAEKFKKQPSITKRANRPSAQAVFCIDVRSEVYRRNLEMADPNIETIGFAGFFGFPIKYYPMAYQEGKNQCPVLIPSGPVIRETLSDEKLTKKASKKRIVKHQVEKTWKSFKSGGITSFSFVSPLGLSYLPKLLSDSFGWTRPVDDPDYDGLGKWMKEGRELDLSEISLQDKVNMATSALTAMGLKDNIAPLVLIAGHGASSVNNPHATGLDCGACGGHSGEINAMTAEKILNNKEVRTALAKKGIIIPEDTYFIAGLHNTTTDEIKIIGERNVPSTHIVQLQEIKITLHTASEASRKERAPRLSINPESIEKSIFKRSKDWSQVRPEWGLAGCNTFIIAPRHRTRRMNLNGQSFLHNYDWKTDEEFSILETIITAPMVVTSWINLQYYASTTDQQRFGAGNKTLHNVTGGIGVLEGSGGDLRIGLPLQSIHDGKDFQHYPHRLSVIVEAPIKAINGILEKHPNVKDLCDNEWISLLQLNENGKISHRYNGNLNWKDIGTPTSINNEEALVMA